MMKTKNMQSYQQQSKKRHTEQNITVKDIKHEGAKAYKLPNESAAGIFSYMTDQIVNKEIPQAIG